jgi:aryl-alcohol dehydrogenase-like predicted oxidoreductase
MMQGSGNPVFEKFTERNWRILEVLLGVARELGRSPAQVAINWVTRRPGVTSTLIGASKASQLTDNLSALEFDLPTELVQKLEESGRPESVFPYMFFQPAMQGMLTGGARVRREPRGFR